LPEHIWVCILNGAEELGDGSLGGTTRPEARREAAQKARCSPGKRHGRGVESVCEAGVVDGGYPAVAKPWLSEADPDQASKLPHQDTMSFGEAPPSIRRVIWDGSIPVQILLNPGESRVFDNADPFYVRRSLPIYYPTKAAVLRGG